MPFSRNFALLVLAGTIPLFAASFIGGAFYAFIVYNALLLMLLAADIIITPGGSNIEVSRISEEKLSLGSINEIVIKVRNNSKYTLNLELRDEVPDHFKVEGLNVAVKVMPHEETEGKYYVIPSKRGEFTFGEIHLRYTGVFKLCMKRARFDQIRSYKVYPNFRDLRRFSLAALKKSSLIPGTKKTRSFGTGTEFESLREYSKGDEYRKINWMATARSHKLIVNNYEPERNQQVFILLDSSRVMNSEINYIKKLDYAVNSAFVLADFVIKKGDSAGVLVFDSDVKRYIKPGKGTGHFQLIAENLYNVEENMVTADYENALVYLNANHKRRSLLCIFTELFNSDDALLMVNALKKLAARHIPLIITIKDMRLYEKANSEIRESSDVFLKSAAIKLIEERERVKSIFRNAGISCIDIPPDQLSIEVINKYLDMKAMLKI